MINGETIKSLYDDKPTLMRWLKKVEAAVKATALEAITYRNDDGNTRIVAAFADGTEIASDPIKNLQVDELYVSNTAEIDTLERVQHLGVDDADIYTLKADNINVAHDAVIKGSAGVSGNMGIDKHLNVKGLIMTATGLSTPLLTTSGDYINAEKPVVEVMTGYSFQQLAPDGLTIDTIYAGISKNANKLTIVYFTKITPTATASGFRAICSFIVPDTIAQKLNPTQIGNYNALLVSRVEVTQDASLFRTQNYGVFKSNNVLTFGLLYPADLVVGATYFARFEVTLLLSNNMAA